MNMTEEGIRKGVLSVFKANELRANLTYQHTEDYSSAAAYLQRALDQEEANDPETRTDLLYHLATIYHTARDFTPCLAACTEGKEIAHGIGRTYDVHAFDFLAGSCLWSMGEEETGMKMMTEAISGASDVAKSQAEYGHLVRFSGQLINSYLDEDQYEAALRQADVYAELLTRMQKNFPDTPAAYLDRSWFYIEMDRAVCYAQSGDRAKAEETVADANKRRFAGTSGGQRRLAYYYSVVGDPANVLKIFTEDIPYTDEDTVTREYRLRLDRIRDAYRNAGMQEEYKKASARYDALNAQLEVKENSEGLGVKAAKYEALHHRLLHEDTLKSLLSYKLGLYVLGGLILIVLIALFILNRRRQAQQRRHNQIIEKEIRSLRQQVSLMAEKNLGAQASDKQNISLAELVEGQQLYLNKNLNREVIADILGVSQSDLTKMLREIQPGLGFPDYIKGLRLRHAIQLMGEDPDIPVADLADRCGFYSVRTFQRSFQALTGSTPSDYAKNLKSTHN